MFCFYVRSSSSREVKSDFGEHWKWLSDLYVFVDSWTSSRSSSVLTQKWSNVTFLQQEAYLKESMVAVIMYSHWSLAATKDMKLGELKATLMNIL